MEAQGWVELLCLRHKRDLRILHSTTECEQKMKEKGRIGSRSWVLLTALSPPISFSGCVEGVHTHVGVWLDVRYVCEHMGRPEGDTGCLQVLSAL